MKSKELLVQILSQDERIRRYEKDPTEENAHKCIQAYKEAVVEFCKRYDDQGEMTLQQKFDLLGAYDITLIQRRDIKHWRLGLDRKNENDYLFICEYPTIEECLDRAITFVTQNK